ncbi:MAG: multicopper oxidase domain-containing protein [Cypionkella sp.]
MTQMHPTRRQILLGSAGLAATGLIRPAFGQAKPLLTVASRQIEVLGRAAKVYGLTDAMGKPGLSAREGDRMTGLVQNATDTPLIMHWHGQVLAAEGQDRAYTGGGATAPGSADTVDFPLTPGTHWMHAHQMTEQQLLAAPMITREADAEDIQEHVILLHDFSFKTPEEILAGLGASMMHGHDNGTAAMPGMDHGASDIAGMDHSKMSGMSDMQAPAKDAMAGMSMSNGMMVHANDVTYDAYLANDRTLADPEVVQVDKSARIRLRIINGATASAFWIDTGPLASACIATDGGACAPFTASRYPIAMGQRLDIVVTIPPEGGAFPIFAQVEAAKMRTGIILATAGAQIPKLADKAETDSPNLDISFDAGLTALKPLPEAQARMVHIALGEEAGYRFTINGKARGEDSPIAARLGERIELMFMNPTMMMHPMHLHGHHFQVVDLGSGRFNGPRRDVVVVNPGAMVTVAVDLDKKGSWFLHCHHLYHMATGMMTELLVT